MTIQISYHYADYTVSDCKIEGKKFWYKEYLKDGLLHRSDGPAVEYANGGKEYWVEGNLHRLDGPAIIYYAGGKDYYINGINVTSKLKNIKEEDVSKYLKILSL